MFTSSFGIMGFKPQQWNQNSLLDQCVFLIDWNLFFLVFWRNFRLLKSNCNCEHDSKLRQGDRRIIKSIGGNSKVTTTLLPFFLSFFLSFFPSFLFIYLCFSFFLVIISLSIHLSLSLSFSHFLFLFFFSFFRIRSYQIYSRMQPKQVSFLCMWNS